MVATAPKLQPILGDSGILPVAVVTRPIPKSTIGSVQSHLEWARQKGISFQVASWALKVGVEKRSESGTNAPPRKWANQGGRGMAAFAEAFPARIE